MRRPERIPNISDYFTFNYTGDGQIVAFRGYLVGNGKKISTAKYREVLTAPINPTVRRDFLQTEASRNTEFNPRSKTDPSRALARVCPQPGCIVVMTTEEEEEGHQHRYRKGFNCDCHIPSSHQRQLLSSSPFAAPFLRRTSEVLTGSNWNGRTRSWGKDPICRRSSSSRLALMISHRNT